MPAWGPRVQKVITSQPFLTSTGPNGYRLYTGTFVILRVSSSSVLKDLFQDGLILKRWQNPGERLLLPGLVEADRGSVGAQSTVYSLVQNFLLSLRVYDTFCPPHWVKKTESERDRSSGMRRLLAEEFSVCLFLFLMVLV